MKKRRLSSPLNRVLFFLILLLVQEQTFSKAHAEEWYRHENGVTAIVVRGIVKDPQGNPLVGATITEKGTKNAVVAGSSGGFTITVNDGAVLVISYVGYEVQELPTTTGDELDITLLPLDINTTEVVVTA